MRILSWNWKHTFWICIFFLNGFLFCLLSQWCIKSIGEARKRYHRTCRWFRKHRNLFSSFMGWKSWSGSDRVDFWWDFSSQLDVLNWQEESVLVLSSSNVGTVGLWLHPCGLSPNCSHLTVPCPNTVTQGVRAGWEFRDGGPRASKMLILLNFNYPARKVSWSNYYYFFKNHIPWGWGCRS